MLFKLLFGDLPATAGKTNESTRETWVRQALQRVPAGARLLDAGAGEQPYRSSCQHLRYISQDFAKYDPAAEKTGLQMNRFSYEGIDHVCDITAIPEPDASFDAILCTEVLEHLPDPLAALREFARLLRPGGTAILTAPFCSLTHFAPHHYSTGFSRYFYEKHLAELGFEIEELLTNGNYFEYIAQELNRLHDMCSRYATGAITRTEYWAISLLLRLLDRLSRQDRGSSEILCYGLHVRATRKG